MVVKSWFHETAIGISENIRKIVHQKMDPCGWPIKFRCIMARSTWLWADGSSSHGTEWRTWVQKERCFEEWPWQLNRWERQGSSNCVPTSSSSRKHQWFSSGLFGRKPYFMWTKVPTWSMGFMFDDLQVNIYHHSNLANQNIRILPAGSDESIPTVDEPPRKKRRLPQAKHPVKAPDVKGILNYSLVCFSFFSTEILIIIDSNFKQSMQLTDLVRNSNPRWTGGQWWRRSRAKGPGCVGRHTTNCEPIQKLGC